MQYRDLIRGVFLEEISHVELVQHTINQLLAGSGAELPGNAGADGADLLDNLIKWSRLPKGTPSRSCRSCRTNIAPGFTIFTPNLVVPCQTRPSRGFDLYLHSRLNRATKPCTRRLW